MSEVISLLDFWDYVTFLALFAVAMAGIASVVFILGLPGRIAYARQHPDAEAINLMGWLGFLGVVPWMQAFLWAFKPTDVVDIRRFPREERKAIAEIMAQQAGKKAPVATALSEASDPHPAAAPKLNAGESRKEVK